MTYGWWTVGPYWPLLNSQPGRELCIERGLAPYTRRSQRSTEGYIHFMILNFFFRLLCGQFLMSIWRNRASSPPYMHSHVFFWTFLSYSFSCSFPFSFSAHLVITRPFQPTFDMALVMLWFLGFPKKQYLLVCKCAITPSVFWRSLEATTASRSSIWWTNTYCRLTLPHHVLDMKGQQTIVAW